jgi:hypothetical protein
VRWFSNWPNADEPKCKYIQKNLSPSLTIFTLTIITEVILIAGWTISCVKDNGRAESLVLQEMLKVLSY